MGGKETFFQVLSTLCFIALTIYILLNELMLREDAISNAEKTDPIIREEYTDTQLQQDFKNLTADQLRKLSIKIQNITRQQIQEVSKKYDQKLTKLYNSLTMDIERVMTELGLLQNTTDEKLSRLSIKFGNIKLKHDTEYNKTLEAKLKELFNNLTTRLQNVEAEQLNNDKAVNNRMLGYEAGLNKVKADLGKSTTGLEKKLSDNKGKVTRMDNEMKQNMKEVRPKISDFGQRITNLENTGKRAANCFHKIFYIFAFFIVSLCV